MEAGWRETRLSSHDHLGVLILLSPFFFFCLCLCLSLCTKASESYLSPDMIRIPDPLLGERAWGMILCKYGIMLSWCKKRM